MQANISSVTRTPRFHVLHFPYFKNKTIREMLLGLMVVLSVFPTACFAWSATTTVSGLQVFDDGHVVIKFAGFTGVNACGSDFFSLGKAGSVQQRAMHATALTALSSGKTVSVGTAAGVCNGGEEVVSYLMIRAE